MRSTALSSPGFFSCSMTFSGRPAFSAASTQAEGAALVLQASAARAMARAASADASRRRPRPGRFLLPESRGGGVERQC